MSSGLVVYRPCVELEPGDRYLWRELGRVVVREVLGVLELNRPHGSVLLEVRRADGNTAVAHLFGSVDVLEVAS